MEDKTKEHKFDTSNIQKRIDQKIIEHQLNTDHIIGNYKYYHSK